MIAHDMYCISLVELDEPVLRLPKFRSVRKFPVPADFGFPEKNVLTVFSFS